MSIVETDQSTAATDQVELNSLLMVGNKQTWLNRVNEQSRAALSSMASAAGLNGVASTATTPAPTTGTPDAIKNRSPETTNNNYPVAPAKSDAPWVALIFLVLVLATILGLLLWKASQPTTTPTTTVQPTQPGQGTVQIPGGYQIQVQPFDPFKQN